MKNSSNLEQFSVYYRIFFSLHLIKTNKFILKGYNIKAAENVFTSADY